MAYPAGAAADFSYTAGASGTSSSESLFASQEATGGYTFHNPFPSGYPVEMASQIGMTLSVGVNGEGKEGSRGLGDQQGAASSAAYDTTLSAMAGGNGGVYVAPAADAPVGVSPLQFSNPAKKRTMSLEQTQQQSLPMLYTAAYGDGGMSSDSTGPGGDQRWYLPAADLGAAEISNFNPAKIPSVPISTGARYAQLLQAKLGTPNGSASSSPVDTSFPDATMNGMGYLQPQYDTSLSANGNENGGGSSAGTWAVQSSLSTDSLRPPPLNNVTPADLLSLYSDSASASTSPVPPSSALSQLAQRHQQQLQQQQAAAFMSSPSGPTLQSATPASLGGYYSRSPIPQSSVPYMPTEHHPSFLPYLPSGMGTLPGYRSSTPNTPSMPPQNPVSHTHMEWEAYSRTQSSYPGPYAPPAWPAYSSGPRPADAPMNPYQTMPQSGENPQQRSSPLGYRNWSGSANLGVNPIHPAMRSPLLGSMTHPQPQHVYQPYSTLSTPYASAQSIPGSSISPRPMFGSWIPRSVEDMARPEVSASPSDMTSSYSHTKSVSPVIPKAGSLSGRRRSAEADGSGSSAKRRKSNGKSAKASEVPDVRVEVKPVVEVKVEDGGDGKASAEVKPTKSKPRARPTVSSSGSESPKKPIPIACHSCRAKKLKCDGVRPKCHNCVRRDEPVCSYDLTLKRRGPGKSKATDKPRPNRAPRPSATGSNKSGRRDSTRTETFQQSQNVVVETPIPQQPGAENDEGKQGGGGGVNEPVRPSSVKVDVDVDVKVDVSVTSS